MKKIALSLMLALAFCTAASAQKWENIAQTPQMGWNSWNKFACNIDERLIKATADKMVELGLVDAGYVYLCLDDCWHGRRDADGFIQADSERFPSGMKALGDYLHSRGLGFGIYSCAGSKTCAGRPGSLGHEYQDALQYARWGVDYLKYDWCYSDDIDAKGAYRLMRDALREAGRPILFSMCEWGSNQPWLWASEIGHSWRTTGDIAASYRSDVNQGGWTARSVLTILDMQDGLREYEGTVHRNDPDMLEVGNGLSENENRAHFSMWCMLSAPLMLGCDLENIEQSTLDVILNREVIAIDQDPLGIQGFKHKYEDGIEYWFKPLADGDWAITLLNRTTEAVSATIDWNSLDLTDELSHRSTDFSKTVYTWKDLWNPSQKGSTAKARTVSIGGDDVCVMRLTPATKMEVPLKNDWIWHSPDKVSIDVDVENNALATRNIKVTLSLNTDKHAKIRDYVKSVKLAPGAKGRVNFSFTVKSGFYTLDVKTDGCPVKTFNIGYDPTEVVSQPDGQPDLKAFWDKTLAELAKTDANPRTTPVDKFSNDYADCHDVTLRSLGGEDFICRVSEPKAEGKYPVIIYYMGYGAKWGDFVPAEDKILIFVSHRGQGLCEPTNKFGDWIQYRLDDPYEYYYRGAFADAVRAIDYACSLKKADRKLIFATGGSQGGALTLVAASLDHRLRAVAAEVPFLSDYPDYFKIVNWPASAVFNAQNTYNLSDKQMYETLSYFDVKNLTPWIECPVWMLFGLQDKTCPPHTNFAGYNNIKTEKEWHVYPLRDHDVWSNSDLDQQKMSYFQRFIDADRK